MPQPSRRFTALVLPSPLNRSASDCCLLSSVHSFFSCYLFCYFCDRIIIPAAKVSIFLQTAKEFTGNFSFFSSDSPSGNPSCMVFWGTGTRKNGGTTILSQFLFPLNCSCRLYFEFSSFRYYDPKSLEDKGNVIEERMFLDIFQIQPYLLLHDDLYIVFFRVFSLFQ